MPGRPFIVFGDRTSHGGVVTEASQVSTTHGKCIARVGDRVTCPKPGHGTTVIITGDPTMIIDGKPVARDGDKCACGAVLIASQSVTTAGGDTGSSQRWQGTAQGAASSTAGVFAAYTSTHDDDEIIEQFYSLLDAEGQPVQGYCYDLYEGGNLKVRSGDFSSGHSTLVQGDATIDIVYWLNKAGTSKS